MEKWDILKSCVCVCVRTKSMYVCVCGEHGFVLFVDATADSRSRSRNFIKKSLNY